VQHLLQLMRSNDAVAASVVGTTTMPFNVQRDCASSCYTASRDEPAVVCVDANEPVGETDLGSLLGVLDGPMDHRSATPEQGGDLA
jgi:hypothetical protein